MFKVHVYVKKSSLQVAWLIECFLNNKYVFAVRKLARVEVIWGQEEVIVCF